MLPCFAGGAKPLALARRAAARRHVRKFAGARGRLPRVSGGAGGAAGCVPAALRGPEPRRVRGGRAGPGRGEGALPSAVNSAVIGLVTSGDEISGIGFREGARRSPAVPALA